ncbi:MAG TPA: hypothetical protein ENK28_15430 [Aliiroseovarius sp.]|nr:hypothetical protein [Aliiroseovarius sp.]
MPNHTQKSIGQFTALKIQTINALIEIETQEFYARKKKNIELADALDKKRLELVASVSNIAKAQRAYLLSSKAMDELIHDMQGQVAQMKQSLADMRKTKDVLENAAKIVQIVTGLLALIS